MQEHLDEGLRKQHRCECVPKEWRLRGFSGGRGLKGALLAEGEGKGHGVLRLT